MASQLVSHCPIHHLFCTSVYNVRVYMYKCPKVTVVTVGLLSVVVSDRRYCAAVCFVVSDR